MAKVHQRNETSRWVALVVALVMCATNLLEPPTVDDVCHYYYAAQVASDPLHPFGFELPWHQKPVAAWDVMVAPVQSYWWAPAIALFGESPVLWKLWFFPFHWLFCASLLAVLRRFVPRQATAALVAVALGPAVLPGINLMLELPMLALGFAGTASLLAAFERRSGGLAMIGGLALGLALQTKYSAMAFFPLWLLLGTLQRRLPETAKAMAVALATAGAIEGLLALSHHGGSYFLRQLENSQARDWVNLLSGMVVQTGLLALPAAFVGLSALGGPRWLRGLLLVAHGVGYAVIAGFPDTQGRGLLDGAADSLAFLWMAAATWAALLAVFGRIGWSAVHAVRRGHVAPAARMRIILCGWFVSEVVMSFVMSPFPAARRTLMVVLVATVAAGWLAAHTRQLRLLRQGAVAAVLLGLCYQGVDVLEGRACVEATRQAQQIAARLAPSATVWFNGGWGFEFHAPRAGMSPLLRGRCRIQAGDIVCVGSVDGNEGPWFEPHAALERVGEVRAEDPVPLSLLLGYYSGRRPIEGQAGPRFLVWLYRARRDLGDGDLVAKAEPWRDH